MLLLSLAALGAHPDVLTVDAYGHGTHTEIQAAVDAAADGDTIVVHSLDDHLEFFSGFTVDGKSLTLHSQGTPQVDGLQEGRRGILLGPVRVRGLDAGQTVTLRGFHLGGAEFVPSPFAPGPGLSCESSSGSVRIEQCTIRPHAGGAAPSPAMTAYAVADLSVVGSVIEGGQDDHGDSGGALLAVDSRVALYSSQVLGSDGRTKFEYQAEVYGGHGGTGIRLEGRSFGWIANCEVSGGNGGRAVNFNALPYLSVGGDGGDGVWVDGPSYCGLLETSVVPGSLGEGSQSVTNVDGTDGIAIVGSVAHVPGELRRLGLPAVGRSGDVVPLTVTGLPGERVTLLEAQEGGLRFLGPLIGLLQLRTPYSASPVEVGVIPASGMLEVDVELPAAPSGGAIRRTFQALCSTSPTRFRLSSPRTITTFAHDVDVILPGDRVHIDSRAGDGELGRDWDSARSDLGAALRAAPYDMDRPVEFWLKAGRYVPATSGQPEALRLRSGVRLYGGFAGVETARAQRDHQVHRTFFDGDVEMNDSAGGLSDNVATLLRSGFDSNRRANVFGVVVDGVGFYRSYAGPAVDVSGGIEFRSCVFDGHDTGPEIGSGRAGALQYGRAPMNMRERSTLTVDRCVFRQNRGLLAGAMRVRFEREGYGPPLQEPKVLVTSCQFIGNEAIRDVFSGSGEFSYGEAISLYLNARSSPDPSVNLENNTFFRNGQRQGSRAAVSFGGYQSYSSSYAKVVNNIFWENYLPGHERNALSGFSSNSPRIVSNCVSYPTTFLPFVDTIHADPRFVNPSGADGVIGTADDDLRLQAGSALVDRGASHLLSGGHLKDFAGADRRRDDPSAPDTGTGEAPHVDLGAFER